MSKRAIIYARVSSDEQTKNNSLPTQLEAMRQYAERQGFTIVQELREDYTGTKLDRPEMSKARVLVKERKVDALIAYASDRLTRNPADGIVLREEFARSSVELHYATRGKVDMSPDAEMFSGFEDLLARGWLLRMKEAMTRGRWGKAKGDPTSGKPAYIPGNGRPPYGYTKAGGPKATTLEPVPEQAETVRLIFGWYVQDKLPVTEIVSKLQGLGVRPPGERPGNFAIKRPAGVWTPYAVYQILRKETYAGVYYCHALTKIDGKYTKRPKDEWIAIPVPAIIDRSLWEAAQQRLNSGKEQSPRNAKYQHLLSRRLRCSCGYAVNQKRGYNRKGEPTRFYYRCSSMQGHGFVYGACGAGYVSAELVDQAAWEWVKALLTDTETLLHGYQAQQQEQQARNADLYDRLAILDDRIRQEQRKQANLLDLFLDDQLPREMLYQRQHTIEETLTALQNERETVARQVATEVISDAHIQTIKEYGRLVHDELDNNTSYAFRRGLVEDLDLTGTLAIEDDQPVLYLHWLTHTDRVCIASEFDTTGR